MEWLDKIKDFPNLIQQEPRYGYLVVRRQLLDESARSEDIPVLAGSDSCRRDRTGPVPVLYFRQIADCSSPGCHL